MSKNGDYRNWKMSKSYKNSTYAYSAKMMAPNLVRTLYNPDYNDYN